MFSINNKSNIKKTNYDNIDIKISLLSKLILILIPFFMLVGAEILCIIFFKEPKPMGEIIKILEQHNELFWIQKSSLNTTFQGTQIITDSFGLRIEKNNSTLINKSRPKILCLGASPTFGWGVEANNAYPAIIQKKLSLNFPEKNYRVINCGCIGFTSHQGIILTNKLLKKYSPDYVTVSYLVNEVDKYRFFRNYPVPDKDVPIINNSRIKFENIINKSIFYRFFRHSLLKLIGKPGFSKQIFDSYSRCRRVSPDDYKKNITKIIELIKNAGAVPILIKTHVRFPDKDIKTICNNFDSRKSISNDIANIISFAEEKKYKKSLKILDTLIHNNSWLPELKYLKGLISNSLNLTEASKKAFRDAQKNELAECSYLSIKYENKMCSVSKLKNVQLIDITKKFKSFGPDYGKLLYVNPKYDFVHPNKKGHKIIGKEVSAVITKLLNKNN